MRRKIIFDAQKTVVNMEDYLKLRLQSLKKEVRSKILRGIHLKGSVIQDS